VTEATTTPSPRAPERVSPPRRRWRWLNRLLVLSLLLLAVALAGLRATLSSIAGREAEVAYWLSGKLGTPVTVGSISGGWRGWAPVLELDGVALGNAADGFRIGRVALSLDPYRSLEERRLVPDHIEVSGLNLVLRETIGQGWSLAGLAPSAAGGDEGYANLAGLLGQLGDLRIEAERLRIETPRLAQPLDLASTDLQLEASAGGALLQLEGSLPVAFGQRIRGQLEWTPAGPGSWYAEATSLDLAGVDDLLPDLAVGAGGRLDLRLWGGLADHPPGLIKARGEFRKLQAGGIGEPLFDRLELSLQGQAGPAGYQFDYRIEKAESPRGRWPDAGGRVELELDNDRLTTLRLRSDFLRLDDLGLGALLEPATAGLQLQGDLRAVAIDWSPAAGLPAGLAITADYTGLAILHPGLAVTAEGLRGHLDYRAGVAKLDLEARALHLGGSRVAELGLPDIPALRGQIEAEYGSQGWRLASSGLDIETIPLSFSIQGELAQAVGAASPEPLADLALQVQSGDLTRLAELLPALPRLDKTRAWMRHRLKAGRISGGAGVLRGALSGWPYGDASGQAELRLDFTDSEVLFNDAWPPVTALAGAVSIKGVEASLRAESGLMLGARLNAGTGGIADVRADQPQLLLDVAIATDGPTSKRILRESPLRDGPGRRLAKLDVSGPLEYQLKLEVPLYDGPETEVDGTVRLAGNTLGMGRDLKLEQVTGKLGFTRDTWGGQDVAARYEGRPVTVNAGSIADAEGGGSRIRLAGRTDREYLAHQVAQHAGKVAAYFETHKLWERFSGETDFLAEIRIPPREAPATAETMLTVRSSLQGMTLELPAPLGKPADLALPLTLETGLDEEPDDRLVRLNLADRLDLAVRLVRDPQAKPAEGETATEREFTGATLSLGSAAAAAPTTSGVAVSGSLPAFRLTDWERLLATPPGVTEDGSDLNPLRIDVSVADLEVSGQRFDAVHVNGTRSDAAWQLRAESAATAGNVLWPEGAGRAELHFERLALRPDPDAEAGDPTNPGTLPPISASAREFSYAGNRLGGLMLETEPDSDGRGLQLKQLKFESERFTVDAIGRWQGRGKFQNSQFSIDLKAADMGKLLESFGYTSGALEGGKTSMRIDARWPGGPQDFRLDILAGSLDMQITEGRLLDVDPKAGRLFGLLSLQTLPRRLALDFGDLFGKGFSFDSIDGSFRISDGNAQTEDLVMVGPAARIEVRGRTGLARRDYDQRVVVIPSLSSNLPVASALFGPVGIGIGAALYVGQQMFKGIPGAIDSVLSQHYTVTGPWTEPVITKQEAAARPAKPGPG
jgi:uncharacterized protein (TIGR02099 family)